MNEIVKYHNDFGKIALTSFSATEMDLLFVLCNQVKDKGCDEIEFSFNQLKSLSKYKPTANSRFIKDLDRTNKKLVELNLKIENEKELIRFSLFPTFKINKDNLTLKVAVNKEFAYILNELTSNFTRFELKEFTDLKSSYSKALYRILKQFRTTGYYTVSVDIFRKILDIPNSYDMRKIQQKVLNPIENELYLYFKNLRIEKIKKKARGNPVIGFEFYFDKEKIEKATKNTGLKCPYCGDYLVQKKGNFDNLFWCHEDGHLDSAKCHKKFNSANEIHSIKNKYNKTKEPEPTVKQTENKKRLSQRIAGLFK